MMSRCHQACPGILVILLFVLSINSAWAQAITCKNGEIHNPIKLSDVTIQYSGKSFQAALDAIGGLAAHFASVQVPLQQATAATQQWDEYLKGLVAGYNSCAVSNAQYAEGLKSIYPQLTSDAAKIDDIRKLLAQQRKLDERQLKDLLDTYFAHLSRFADLSGKSEIIAAITTSTNRVIDEVQGQAVIGRVYNDPLTLITIGASFGDLKPEDVSLQLITRKGPPIRFDFTATKVTVTSLGSESFDNPTTPSMAEEAAESKRYIYFVDFTYLQRAAPSHPLSKLAPANLENAPVHLLLSKQAIDRLASSDKKVKLNIFMSAEVSGYEFELLTLNFSGSSKEFSAMPWPRDVPDKPGFALMVGDWRTSNINLKVSGQGLSGDIEQTSEFLDRESDLAGWRGLWPDKTTLMLFSANYGVPSDENKVVFHPFNHRFVRLREDFASSGGCEVPGIAAFQVSPDNFFFLYVNVNYRGTSKPEWEPTAPGGSISLTIEETTTLFNIVREVALLNDSWGNIEGNVVRMIVVLMPGRSKFIALSPIRFANYARTLTQRPSDMKAAVEEGVSKALVMVMPISASD